MAITSNWIITHDGITYPAGEVIFVLPETLEEQYIRDGIATKVTVIETPAAPITVTSQTVVPSNFVMDGYHATASSAPPEDPNNGLQQPGDPEGGGDALTPEEFAKLTAPEQKKELEALEIEPDSNASGRLAQYTEWYNQPVDEDLDPDNEEL